MAQSEGEANDPRPNERPEDIEEDKLSANTGQEDEAQCAVRRQRSIERQKCRRQVASASSATQSAMRIPRSRRIGFSHLGGQHNACRTTIWEPARPSGAAIRATTTAY